MINGHTFYNRINSGCRGVIYSSNKTVFNQSETQQTGADYSGTRAKEQQGHRKEFKFSSQNYNRPAESSL